MGLFHFGKKKEEKRASACCCSGADVRTEPEQAASCCGQPADGICCIKVLGSGCKSCHALLEAVQQAVENRGLPVAVEYVTDMEKIMAYGVMQMPALVINEQVASMGKVLKPAEVERLLGQYEGCK